MKKKIFSLFAVLSLSVFVLQSAVIAASVSSFLINVTPNPLTPGEAADMTITAVDNEGKTVTDYKGTIILDFDTPQDSNVYEMPSDGFYTFLDTDQGTKTFNKGFVIKQPGSYVLKAYDAENDGIVGSLQLTVGASASSSSPSTGQRQITIQEPLENATLKGSSINVIGETDSRNTPLQFFIDDKKLTYTGETDDAGVFSVYLTEIEEGDHSLVVKMIDYQGNVIGESTAVNFSYQAPQMDEFLKEFKAQPDGEVALGQSVSFSAKTDATIRSVQLTIGSGEQFMMDRVDSGVFIKTIKTNKEGLHKVDAMLIDQSGKGLNYADVATLHVKVTTPLKDPAVGIGTLKVVNDAADPTQATLSWSIYGQPTSYLIRYGTSQDDLSKEVKVKETQVRLSGLEIGKKYYFQVFALNGQGITEGTPSDIAMIMTQGQQQSGTGSVSTPSPSCAVVGIKLSTKKIGDDYFLVRDAVPHAVEYRIYRSDYEVNSIDRMQKIGTTTIPQFSYPFNAQAAQDEYSYYAVVAVCSDGTDLQIDNVKKVHTGPVSDIIILIIISSLIYLIVRTYNYRS